MTFLIVLAWIFGVLSSILTLARVGGFIWHNFTKSGQLAVALERMKGYQTNWGPMIPGIISIICWTFIFTI